MGQKFTDSDQSLNKLLFTPSELRQILSAYGEGVMGKGWRDYAITSLPRQSIFSVVDHMAGEGTGQLYGFSKERSQKAADKSFYRLFYRSEQIFRSESFLETLEAFRTLDKKGGKRGKVDLKVIK